MASMELLTPGYSDYVVVQVRGELDTVTAAETRQRLRTTRTDRHRPIVVAIRTVSAAPAGRSMPSTVHRRLKPLVSRAEVCTDLLGARVCLQLPLAAG
jgi:hypothetical protein